MPNFKIKAYIGDVPDGGCVPVFTIASPNQEGEDYYDTLAEAKESLLAQVKASGRLGREKRLESAYIRRVTLRALFTEHFAYFKYVEDLSVVNDKPDEPDILYDDSLGEIDYPIASEIVKA